MPNEPSKQSSLFPSSDGEREDSGLQDILSVATNLKDKSDESAANDDAAEDSGLILFSTGDDTKAADDDDDALFGSFSSDLSGGLGGGLGAGFGAATEPPASSAADLTPLAGEGRVSEARPAEVAAKPPPAESKRSPLVAVAVVLGLALAGVAAVMLTNKDEAEPQPQAQAGMSAPEDEAAVGKAVEEPTPEAESAAAGSAGAVAPEPEPEPEPESEVVLDDGDPLAGIDANGDPLSVREGLLENDGTNGVKKAGEWDQGTSYAKPENNTPPKPAPEPEPEEEDDDPLPLPEPKKQGSVSDPASDEEVDCLLNPDLPKCQKAGGDKKPKEQEILAPKIPEKLSSSQLRDGFNGVKSSAKKCGQQNGVPPGTSVKVHVSIEGATGKVTDVKATGEHAGTPLGKCVEDAVKNAQFEVFKKPAMGVDYPMIM